MRGMSAARAGTSPAGAGAAVMTGRPACVFE